MRLLIKVCCLLPVLLLSGRILRADLLQEEPLFPALPNGKVGLVLSGGGAKGLAHIGVIKALEDNDIPIDYITGTSMGAIIGGLYAAGYSPEEMLELFLSEEFSLWSKGEIDEKYGYFSYKLSPQPDMFSMALTRGNKNKPSPVIPTHLVASFPMDLGMIKTFARASSLAGNDFDSLFVPFRCVAADVNAGEAFIASRGDLGTMIRASMSYPLYFKPVRLDSATLLFDGGINNNFPWDIMEKDFGPQYIIGSKCAGATLQANEDDLMGQIERMIMYDTNYELPSEKGLVIETRMDAVGILDFHKVRELMAFGYNQTLKIIDSLKTVIPGRRTAFDVAMKRINFRASMPPLQIRNVLVTEGDLNENQRGFTQKNMVFDSKKTFDIEQFKNVYYKMISSGNVKTFYPTAVYDSTHRAFDVHIRAKQGPETKISIGGNIGSGNLSQGYLGFEHLWWEKKITRLNADFHIGRLYSSLKFSVRQDFPAKRPFFYEISGTFNRFRFFDPTAKFFSDNALTERRKETDQFGEIAVGSTLRKNTSLRFGIASGQLQSDYLLKNTVGKTTEPFTHSTLSYQTVHASFQQNTLNFKQFPTKGSTRKLEVKLVAGKETHLYTSHFFQENWHRPSAHGLMESYYRLSPLITLGVYAEGAYTGKTRFSDYGAMVGTLQGFTPTPHSKTVFLHEYRANAWGALGAIPVFTLTERISLRFGAYLFQPYEPVRAGDNMEIVYGKAFSYRAWIGLAAATWQSPIGPVSFSVNYYDKGPQNFNYLFNFGYILFNARGI